MKKSLFRSGQLEFAYKLSIELEILANKCDKFYLKLLREIESQLISLEHVGDS